MTRRWGRNRPLSRRTQEALVGYAMVAPDLIGLTIFVILPIMAGALISLHDWNGLSSPTYVGLDNYAQLVQDPAFIASLRITIVYSVAFVACVFVASLGLATLLNQRLKGAAFFRTAYFLPVMVSLVVASSIWSLILVQKGGLLNSAIGTVGIEPQPWLGSTRLAMISLVIVTVWQAVGYNTIIFLAGLQDIPRDYFEAASIDGAGTSAQFRRITLPLLRPTSIFVLVTSVIVSFQVFDPIFVLTGGGPASATKATVFLIYENAFQFFKIGYASAIGVVLFLLILAFTLVQLRVLRSE